MAQVEAADLAAQSALVTVLKALPELQLMLKDFWKLQQGRVRMLYCTSCLDVVTEHALRIYTTTCTKPPAPFLGFHSLPHATYCHLQNVHVAIVSRQASMAPGMIFRT